MEKIKNFFNKKIVKNILKTLLAIISVIYFLFIQSIMNSGYLIIGFIPALISAIIFFLVLFIKDRKKINIKETPETLVNNLSLGIFINIIFIILLSLVVNEVSYIYSFGNYAIYSDVSESIYLITSILILPILRNTLVRINLSYITNKVWQKILSIFFILFLLFTAPTLINGIYIALVALIMNKKYIKEKNLLKVTIEEILISLSLSTMTLYLSTYKLPMMIVMIVSVLICFVLNLSKYFKNKEVKESGKS